MSGDATKRHGDGAHGRGADATPSRVDPERLRETARQIFGHLEGAVTAALISLGDALGLYRALADAGADAGADGAAVTPAELAARTGTKERWVREWLYNQAAAGLLETHAGGRFAISPEAAAVLADETHPAFGAGMFSQLPRQLALAGELEASFKSGVGLPYDAFGPEGARGVERGFAPWVRNFLVPLGVSAVAGLRERLTAGAQVADVGCGAGVALIELARAFPKSRFHGYELSRHAIARAEKNRAQEGLRNLHFHHVDEQPLPDDARFDAVLSFDCLHDMTQPARVMAAVRRALSPSGVWWIADIKSYPSFEENIAENPMAAMMYGFSVLTCMSSALAEEGGAGLGTLGLHEELLRKMTRDAGFTKFKKLEIEHPVNAFYEVRP